MAAGGAAGWDDFTAFAFTSAREALEGGGVACLGADAGAGAAMLPVLGIWASAGFSAEVAEVGVCCLFAPGPIGEGFCCWFCC